jgi:hypothetical protein
VILAVVGGGIVLLRPGLLSGLTGSEDSASPAAKAEPAADAKKAAPEQPEEKPPEQPKTASAPSDATMDPEAGGTVGLPDGARLDIPKGALTSRTELSLEKRSASAELSPDLASDVYYVSAEGGRATGTFNLIVPFDPSRLKDAKLAAFAVIDDFILLPAESTIDLEKKIVTIVRPDVNVRGAPEGLHKRTSPYGMGSTTNDVGYAVGRARDSHLCKLGRKGEVHNEPGHAFSIIFKTNASCDLATRVSNILTSTLVAYARDYPDAKGSPLRRYTPNQRMRVYLGEYAGVNGEYSFKSWNGHMYVDAKSALANADALRETLFHEMFHAVQDHYWYVWGGAMFTSSRWWIEATAEWAGLVARGVTFAQAVPHEIQTYPALLSLRPPDTTGHGGDTVEYGVSLFIYHIESLSPGYVKRTLQAKAMPTSTTLYKEFVAAGQLARTYPDFVKKTVEIGIPKHWASGRVFVADDKVVRFKPLGSEIGAKGQGKDRETKIEPGSEIEEGFTVHLQPLTTQFVGIQRGAKKKQVEVTAELKRQVGGGSGTAWHVRASAGSGGSATALPAGENEIDAGSHWIAMYNPSTEEAATYTLTVVVEHKTADLSGAWDSNHGCVQLKQSDSRVMGSIVTEKGDEGSLSGTLDGDKLAFRYSVGKKAGNAKVKISEDEKGMSGSGWNLRKRRKKCQKPKPDDPKPDDPKPDDPKPASEPHGVFVANGYVLVGQKKKLEAIPSCRLGGWGLDCKKTVGQKATLKRVLGPFSARTKAVNAYCNAMVKGSVRYIQIAHGTKADFSFGKNLWIHNAPGCK